MFYNKKGISEIVSYLLLTLLIVVVATTTFFFAQNYLDDLQAEEEYTSMESHLKKMKYSIEEIKSFENETSTYFIKFSTGQIETRGNALQYASEVSFEGDDFCLEVLCYKSRGGFGVITTNLSNNYSFSENTTLTPGEYFLEFRHDKKGEQIDISAK